MCHTVYTQIFSISASDVFRHQLRICYQLTLTKTERLSPIESVIQCKFTLRLINRCFIDRGELTTNQSHCIIDIAGKFLHNFYSGAEIKPISPSCITYGQHEMVSLRQVCFFCFGKNETPETSAGNRTLILTLKPDPEA